MEPKIMRNKAANGELNIGSIGLKQSIRQLNDRRQHQIPVSGVSLTSNWTKDIKSSIMTCDEGKLSHHFESNSEATYTYRSLLLTTIVYYIITCYNAPDKSILVHAWSIGSTGPSDYDFSLPPPLDSITSFWTPRQHNKRQTVFDDSLTNNNGSISPEFSSTNQNGWFDLISNVFQNQRPKPTRPVTVQPKDSLDAHVRNILIPRVSGTQGNVDVRNYIIEFLKGIDYHVSIDEFTDTTPIGNVKFANIIATSDPTACRQLAIACHHDSKMMDGFLGAIDSAVPCAMMLELAQTFKHAFRPKQNNHLDSTGESIGLMFIFFDGEEAFEEWTDLDSLYGSRHLAAKWEKQLAPRHCAGLKNELKRLDLLMVLDLIGTSDTSFTMYSRSLKRHYQSLQKHEREYIKNRFQLQGSQARQVTTFKSNYIPLEFMQDDHVPFYKRGVPVLSLLAQPFPSVWHTVDDNYDAIDFPKTKQILHAIEKFVSNYNSSLD